MANLALLPGLGLTENDFDTPSVHNATHPDPVTGYAHGPIPNNNPDWKPTAWHNATAAGVIKYDITAKDIKADVQDAPPPNPMVVLNKENNLICDIVVKPPFTMCGKTFNFQGSLRRHIRNAHPGALVQPGHSRKTPMERVAGETAIKKWILTLGWQNAIYLNEPGRGSDESMIGFWCDALERIARENPEFRRRFGARFHRHSVHLACASPASNRRLISPLPSPLPFRPITFGSVSGGNDENNDLEDRRRFKIPIPRLRR